MSYTKKPWNIYGGELYADDVVIATLNSCGPCQPHDPSEYEANAHLIAAAPDLYEALKEMRATCAALMRCVAQGSWEVDDIIDAWMAELERLGIPDGIGVRADQALAKADGHDPQQREP